MKKLILALVLMSGMTVYGQTATYRNNYGTNYINGQTGSFTRSSVSWTITQKGNTYTINTDAVSGAITVGYSHFDSSNKLYIYTPSGAASFDGNWVVSVMTNKKLSDLAKGSTEQPIIMSIVFSDNTGYIYKLNK
jgi:hypothetical protein